MRLKQPQNKVRPGASYWLMTLSIAEHGFDLPKGKFRDAWAPLCLRFADSSLLAYLSQGEIVCKTCKFNQDSCMQLSKIPAIKSCKNFESIYASLDCKYLAQFHLQSCKNLATDFPLGRVSRTENLSFVREYFQLSHVVAFHLAISHNEVRAD